MYSFRKGRRRVTRISNCSIGSLMFVCVLTLVHDFVTKDIILIGKHVYCQIVFFFFTRFVHFRCLSHQARSAAAVAAAAETGAGIPLERRGG